LILGDGWRVLLSRCITPPNFGQMPAKPRGAPAQIGSQPEYAAVLAAAGLAIARRTFLASKDRIY